MCVWCEWCEWCDVCCDRKLIHVLGYPFCSVHIDRTHTHTHTLYVLYMARGVCTNSKTILVYTQYNVCKLSYNYYPPLCTGIECLLAPDVSEWKVSMQFSSRGEKGSVSSKSLAPGRSRSAGWPAGEGKVRLYCPSALCVVLLFCRLLYILTVYSW